MAFFSYLQVGDTGPIIDIMAVLLENIPTTATIARAIISSVYRTVQLVASIPNLSYQKKVKSYFVSL